MILCKQLKILPVRYRFDYHDLELFHLIVHKISCIKLPSYLHFYEGSSILRSTHLDHLSIVSTVPTTRRGFTHTYFYRTYLLWNRVPISIREIIRPNEFKIKLVEFIWKELVVSEYDSDNESYSQNLADLFSYMTTINSQRRFIVRNPQIC